MRPMSTIRKWHFEQLRCSLKAVLYIVQTTPAQDLATYRDHDDGWTAAEVIGHLLDCERLFLERARLTMTRDRPPLPFPDQDQEVAQGRYNERDPETIFADWHQVRDEHLAYLETIPDADWEREGTHIKYAPFSLNDQLFLACWHDMLHIRQLTRILTDRRL